MPSQIGQPGVSGHWNKWKPKSLNTRHQQSGRGAAGCGHKKVENLRTIFVAVKDETGGSRNLCQLSHHRVPAAIADDHLCYLWRPA